MPTQVLKFCFKKDSEFSLRHGSSCPSDTYVVVLYLNAKRQKQKGTIWNNCIKIKCTVLPFKWADLECMLQQIMYLMCHILLISLSYILRKQQWYWTLRTSGDILLALKGQSNSLNIESLVVNSFKLNVQKETVNFLTYGMENYEDKWRGKQEITCPHKKIIFCTSKKKKTLKKQHCGILNDGLLSELIH